METRAAHEQEVFEMSHQEWVVVKTEMSRAAAETVAEFLVSNGLEALVNADDGGGTIPALEEAQNAEVLVHEADVDAARELLDEIDAEEGDEDDDDDDEDDEDDDDDDDDDDESDSDDAE
jgi:hypothetical protein